MYLNQCNFILSSFLIPLQNGPAQATETLAFCNSLVCPAIAFKKDTSPPEINCFTAAQSLGCKAPIA
jgi:hypothetical protein